MTALSVNFGGLRFRGYADRDERGFWIAKGGWEGWENPPAQRADIVARANSHGVFDAVQLFDAREVVQSGFFRAESAYELEHMAARLAGVLDGESRVLTVTYGGETRWANVKRGLAEPVIRTSMDGSLFMGEYEIVHRMHDPRKYGQTHTFGPGNSITVFHQGNFPAHPVVEVSGPVAPYTITGPAGEQFVVLSPPGAGQTDRIDFRLGRVYRNGVLVTGVTGRAETWTIPPWGGSVMSISTGVMKVDVPDTII